MAVCAPGDCVHTAYCISRPRVHTSTGCSSFFETGVIACIDDSFPLRHFHKLGAFRQWQRGATTALDASTPLPT
eukprot:scaffold27400_cov140-Isochrysis_galbana.AAC.2